MTAADAYIAAVAAWVANQGSSRLSDAVFDALDDLKTKEAQRDADAAARDAAQAELDVIAQQCAVPSTTTTLPPTTTTTLPPTTTTLPSGCAGHQPYLDALQALQDAQAVLDASSATVLQTAAAQFIAFDIWFADQGNAEKLTAYNEAQQAFWDADDQWDIDLAARDAAQAELDSIEQQCSSN